LKARWIALFSALLLSSAVHAGLILDTPILGGSLLVASDGNVTAEFLGSRAGYYNTLYLETASDWGSDELFNKYTPAHTVIDLGYFTAGTELLFRLYVRNTDTNYYSGNPAGNPDGLAHALAITTLSGGAYVTTVGFEDVLGGGDLDYDDFRFALTNVIDPPPIGASVPIPPALLLLGTGLLAMATQRRRRAARH